MSESEKGLCLKGLWVCQNVCCPLIMLKQQMANAFDFFRTMRAVSYRIIRHPLIRKGIMKPTFLIVWLCVCVCVYTRKTKVSGMLDFLSDVFLCVLSRQCPRLFGGFQNSTTKPHHSPPGLRSTPWKTHAASSCQDELHVWLSTEWGQSWAAGRTCFHTCFRINMGLLCGMHLLPAPSMRAYSSALLPLENKLFSFWFIFTLRQSR